MADDLERLHLNAGMDLLRAQATIATYPDAEGFVPTALTPPHRRVYTSIDRPMDGDANALNGLSATWLVRYYVHNVGANEYAAAALAIQTRTALLDVRPTIAGRSCGMFRQEASQPTQRDSSTGTDAYDRVDVYVLMTAPG